MKGLNLNDLKAGCIREALERGAGVAKPRKPINTGPADGYRSKWERRYAEEVLAARFRAGEVTVWHHEAIVLKIGKGASYKPDFFVQLADGSIELHEVKGFRREAAIVRLKAAALQWPQFRFVFVTRGRGASGWSFTRL